MANQNGLGAQNAAMYSGMNGNVMPPAGHYSDMQTLMQNMESLSGWLEQNRQEWSQVQEGLARVERLQVWLPTTSCDYAQSLKENNRSLLLQGRLAQQGQLPLLNGDTQRMSPLHC